ncbi:ROK family protein [Micromonospora sp. KC606]|uniref:ROK family protein n=1 Tax=Micromonospora sp. KC606 TaxID=2530379 RepID=UPI00104B3946|nr:ROK family protein [Micromonospora sp. KC606]TDC86144.1 ROK family protein [Micromonospora sp. KC606]
MTSLTDAASICVDMGGTTTRIGVCVGGRLLPGPVRFATPKPPPGGSIRAEHLDRIADAVARVRSETPGRAREVGLAVGATVDATGRIRNASMLWHEPSEGFDLAAAMAARLPWASITVANDIAAAAWRYRSLGRFGLVTVSTGVAVKVFDDALPFDRKLLLDADGLGGEVGHVRVDPPAELDGAGTPWCECGNTSDLCSYVSGPATVRLVALLATAWPRRWRDSKLHVLAEGVPERLTSRDLAQVASTADEFAAAVLRVSTRPLAAQLLHMSALLGLRRFVVMGGFANGVGAPWYAALRANLGELLPQGGWFTGWTADDLDALVRPSCDGDGSLLGMAEFLAARRGQYRELHKPVGEPTATVRLRPRPRCGREQFLARVAYAGICGTDLQMLRGERGCEPGVLGHECVAQVVEVGAAVHAVAPGHVIGVNPNHPHDDHDKIGHNQPGVLREIAIWDGALAERGQAVRLPDEGRAEWVLLEPLACAVRSLRLARDSGRGRRVLVVGGGISGLLHVLLARRWGAERVLLANRGGDRLRLAVARGVVSDQDCLPISAGLAAAVLDATGGAGVDAVVVCVSGAGPDILADLWPALADGATVHLFGGFLPGDTVRVPGGDAVQTHPIRCGERRTVRLPDGRAGILLGSRGASADEYREALDLCAGPHGLRLGPLVSHVVSLDAAPAVLDDLAATGRVNGDPALRVVVDLTLPGRLVRAVDGTALPQLRAPS